MGSQRKTKEQLRDWLNLVEEETLEPDIPIIDPHHHLWKRDRPYVIDDLCFIRYHLVFFLQRLSYISFHLL